MGFAKRLNLQNATNIGSSPPRDPVLANIFGLENTASGERVTPESAMGVTAVLSAVQLISDTIASLPLFILERDNVGNKTRRPDHALSELLRLRPNKWQTAFQFWQMMIRHVLLRGNGYALIVSTPVRAVSELVPLHPDRVEPFRVPDGSVAYAYQPESGGKQIILQDEMFHIVGAGSDGIRGVSVIEHARETIGMSLAVEKYGARYFANDAQPGGVLEHPSHFKDTEVFNRFKTTWQAAQSGKNKHTTAILEDGMEFKQLGITNKDSQFLELRQFEIAEVARIFRVPPHLLYDLTKSSFNNIEQQSIEFVAYTMLPWTVRIEQAIWRQLFTETEKQKNQFAEFLLEGLLRGDLATRTEAYQKGRRNGWLNVNEIRRLENMNSIGSDGDIYFVSADLVPVSVATQNNQSGQQQASDRLAQKLYNKAAKRLARKDAAAINKTRQRLQGKALADWIDEYYQKQLPIISDAMLVSEDDIIDSLNEWKLNAFHNDIDIETRANDIMKIGNINLVVGIEPQKQLAKVG